jgi:hypothetical protein
MLWEKLPVDQTKLTHNGHLLERDGYLSLSASGVYDGATLFLPLRL